MRKRDYHFDFEAKVKCPLYSSLIVNYYRHYTVAHFPHYVFPGFFECIPKCLAIWSRNVRFFIKLLRVCEWVKGEGDGCCRDALTFCGGFFGTDILFLFPIILLAVSPYCPCCSWLLFLSARIHVLHQQPTQSEQEVGGSALCMGVCMCICGVCVERT